MQRAGWRHTLGGSTIARPLPSPLALRRPTPCSPRLAPRLTVHSRKLHVTMAASGGKGLSSPPATDIKRPSAAPSSGWRTFWFAVDTTAWLGAVGTAVAFILTSEALLVSGPLVLPLVALFASRQRSQLDSAAAAAEVQQEVAAALRQVASLSEESAAEVAEEVAALVDEVRQGRTAPERIVRSVEAKLAAVESSMRGVGSSTKEALEDAAQQRGRAVKELSGLLGTLRRDLNADFRQATGDELVALGRVDTRLAALEGAISGLEVAQSEGLRRVSSSMGGVMAESRDALEEAVRAEVWRSLEPVRRLPQVLAAAAPGLVADRSLMQPQINEAALKEAIADQIAALGEELLREQRALLQEAGVAAPSSVTIAPAQWNQLGKRLIALEGQLTGVAETTQAFSPPQESLDAAAAASQQLAGLRSDFQSLARTVEDALTQQRAAQTAALGLAGGSAAMDDLLLAPLEEALTRLRDDVRSAAEVAAIDQTADKEASRWIVGLETRLVASLTPALEAIAIARRANADASSRAATATAESSMLQLEQQEVLEEAMGGIAALSAQLESLGGQLETLEGRLEENAVAVAVTATEAAPEPDAAVQAAPRVEEEAGAEDSGRNAAYDRMQELLQGSSSSGNGSSSESTAATGLPIRDWLAGARVPREDDVVEGSVAVPVGAVAPAASASSGGARPVSALLQEQMAFEAGLAAAAGREVDGVAQEEELPQEEPPMEAAAAAASPPQEEAFEEQEREDDMAAGGPSGQGIFFEDENPQALYERGVDLLREGRALGGPDTPGDWDTADAALAEAAACFQAAAAALEDGAGIKALGNGGNALMARAKVKSQMARSTPPGPDAEALAVEAKELLVVAGRRYRELLLVDPTQGRAFLNWGRAVCLRAELAREAGDLASAHSLFVNAAEKFQAALELRADAADALRLAGTSLLSAARCQNGDSEERLRLLEEAEAYLADALASGAPEEISLKLQECRALLAGYYA